MQTQHVGFFIFYETIDKAMSLYFCFVKIELQKIFSQGIHSILAVNHYYVTNLFVYTNLQLFYCTFEANTS